MFSTDFFTGCGKLFTPAPAGGRLPLRGRWQGEALTDEGPSPAWRGWTGEAGTGVEGTPIDKEQAPVNAAPAGGRLPPRGRWHAVRRDG